MTAGHADAQQTPVAFSLAYNKELMFKYSKESQQHNIQDLSILTLQYLLLFSVS
jgi:hypothetical protein